MKIFVSYTKHNDDLRPDLEQSTQVIKKKLSFLGDAFMDYPLHEPSCVWDELDRCDLFVLIKSDNNSKSKWIGEERKRAEAKHKIIVELSYNELLNIKNEDLKKMIQDCKNKYYSQFNSFKMEENNKYVLEYKNELSKEIYSEVFISSIEKNEIKVVEDRNEKTSLYFKEEYKQAVSMTWEIISSNKSKVKSNSKDDSDCLDDVNWCKDKKKTDPCQRMLHQWQFMPKNNRILFLGQRGSGKTSAALSFVRSLEKNGLNVIDEKKATDTIHFKVLPVVDPSYFDENTNILKTVISIMFEMAKCIMKKQEDDPDCQRQFEELLKQFEKVYRILGNIENPNHERHSLEALNEISNASNMRDALQVLVNMFICILPCKAQKLVLVIDDIDMNVSYAAIMLEQIKKFLELDNLIIVMSANLNQLNNEMREHYSKAFQNTLKDSNQALSIDVEDLAAKYLLKLFPTSRRIIVERPVSQLLDTILKIESMGKEGPLQNVVLSLIWEKTRLLFVPKDAKSILHPIVPTNLRELAQFLDMLTSLKAVEKDNENKKLFKDKPAYENCKDNFIVFKNYILKTWIPNHLSVEEELVFENIPSDITEINKHLINSINVIGNRHKTLLMSRQVGLDMIERNAEGVNIDRDIYTMVSLNDPKFVKANKISDIFNQPSNYSYGDLLLMIDKYETYFESEDNRGFTDAIKIYYSMLLFETMFFNSDSVKYDVEEYKADGNVEKVIPIQRLIGGTVYYPNYFEIITDKHFNQKGPSYDAKRAFYHKVEVDNEGKTVSKKCPLFSVLYYGDIRPDRYEKTHIYDTTFKNNAEVDGIKYVTFDILSVFNNMLNPWHTIGRLYDISGWRKNEDVNPDNPENKYWNEKVQSWGNNNQVDGVFIPNAILPFYSVDIMLQYLTNSFSVEEIVNLSKKQYEEKKQDENEKLYKERYKELDGCWEKKIKDFDKETNIVKAILNRKSMFFRGDDNDVNVKNINDINLNLKRKDGSAITINTKTFNKNENDYKLLNSNFQILKDAYTAHKTYSLNLIGDENKLPERISMADSYRNYVIALLFKDFKGGKRERDQLIKNLHKDKSASEIFKHLVSVLWSDTIKDIGVRKAVQDMVHSYAFVEVYYNELWKKTSKLLALINEDEKVYESIFDNAKQTFLKK